MADYNRIISFKEPIYDKVLPGYVIRTEKVKNEGSCRVKCYLDPNCVSINVGPEVEGTRTCELKNFTDESSFLPLFISYRSSGEKFIKYQANPSCVIMSVILMTTLFYKASILLGEI